MIVYKKLVEQGNFLFRWRSFVPLFLLIPGIFAFSASAGFEDLYGSFVSDALGIVGVLVSLAGLAVRWVTVGFVPGSTSGRNTKEQRADHLNVDGMYSIVKNPLYVGNFMTILGVLIAVKVWWMVLIGTLAYWLYIERVIAAEEHFLIEKHGENYTDWAEKTPLFMPDFKLWRKSSMPFSYKTVLKREYNGFFAIGIAFFVSEALIDVGFGHEPFMLWLEQDWLWSAGLLFTALVFLILRTLKKQTGFLKVQGR